MNKATLMTLLDGAKIEWQFLSTVYFRTILSIILHLRFLLSQYQFLNGLKNNLKSAKVWNFFQNINFQLHCYLWQNNSKTKMKAKLLKPRSQSRNEKTEYIVFEIILESIYRKRVRYHFFSRNLRAHKLTKYNTINVFAPLVVVLCQFKTPYVDTMSHL